MYAHRTTLYVVRCVCVLRYVLHVVWYIMCHVLYTAHVMCYMAHVVCPMVHCTDVPWYMIYVHIPPKLDHVFCMVCNRRCDDHYSSYGWCCVVYVMVYAIYYISDLSEHALYAMRTITYGMYYGLWFICSIMYSTTLLPDNRQYPVYNLLDAGGQYTIC